MNRKQPQPNPGYPRPISPPPPPKPPLDFRYNHFIGQYPIHELIKMEKEKSNGQE